MNNSKLHNLLLITIGVLIMITLFQPDFLRNIITPKPRYDMPTILIGGLFLLLLLIYAVYIKWIKNNNYYSSVDSCKRKCEETYNVLK